MRALRPVFILASRLQPQLYMNTPEHAGEALAQLADVTLTPPAGRVYASLVRGQLTYPRLRRARARSRSARRTVARKRRPHRPPHPLSGPTSRPEKDNYLPLGLPRAGRRLPTQNVINRRVRHLNLEPV
jgi:hypothetical protein